MDLTAEHGRLIQIFYPYAFAQQRDVEERRTRFVHYTSSDAALKIARQKEIWMRNATCMSDYREVEYGVDCMKSALQGDAGSSCKDTLDTIFYGLWSELVDLFLSWVPSFITNTYLTCVSEHKDSENEHGRLSMWRANRYQTGVALVLHSAPFLSPSNALNAYTSPVAYLSKDEFAQELQKIECLIRKEAEFLRAIGRERVTAYMFQVFRFGVLCTKHPGFLEEKEWRVVHSPNLEPSTRLKKEVLVINGTPQLIYKIPLQNVAEEGFVGAEIPEILDRIIIGPTEHPIAAREAFVEALSEIGVRDAAAKVFVSEIPLR